MQIFLIALVLIWKTTADITPAWTRFILVEGTLWLLVLLLFIANDDELRSYISGIYCAAGAVDRGAGAGEEPEEPEVLDDEIDDDDNDDDDD